jgi:hypothetical protein
LTDFPHIVNANHFYAGQGAVGDDCCGAHEAILRFRVLRDLSDKRLAGWSDHHGEATAEVGDSPDDFQIVFYGLSEADAGIDDDPRRVKAGGFEIGYAVLNECPDFCDHIDVVRRSLHGLRRPLHVHDYDRGTALCEEPFHFGIAAGS